MPGRNPKLLSAIEADNSRTNYTKAEIAARKANTPVITHATLRAPAWLDAIARKEWRRIIRLARGAEIYTDLDSGALGMYCKAFSRAMQAYNEYDKLEARVRVDRPDANILLDKNLRTNPLLRIAMDAEDQCRKWASILGLDPVSRARIGLARKKGQEKTQFEQLLDDVEDYVNGDGDVE